MTDLGRTVCALSERVSSLTKVHELRSVGFCLLAQKPGFYVLERLSSEEITACR